MNAIEATDVSEQEPIEIIVPKMEAKSEGANKYQCKKCSESFALKVDLKVIQIQFNHMILPIKLNILFRFT